MLDCYLPTVNLASGLFTSKAEVSSLSFTVRSPLTLSGTRHECGQGPLQENSSAAEYTTLPSAPRTSNWWCGWWAGSDTA